jgi:DNA-binding MarR family transcriptional regulator/GNAT superfamily N-acetyltransferase
VPRLRSHSEHDQHSEHVRSEEDEVARVRAFNRFYTRSIGVLRDSLVGSPFSLVEARLLYELAHRPTEPVSGAAGSGAVAGMEGAELRRLLDLDAGYFSRVVARFDTAGLVSRQAHPGDARRQLLRLTEAGHRAFDDLDERQAKAIRALLVPLSADRRATLTEAMGTIERTLSAPARPLGVVLRPPEPGDLGWIVARHGALYVRQYGGDPRFEAMVARIVADYAERPDPAREAVWIAEVDGRPAGSIACMTATENGTENDTAKLRLLLVEPSARGMGVGERLVAECLRFAERVGYRRITLWTTSELAAARRIYQRAGFTLDAEAPFDGFGRGVIGQNWSRRLGAADPG